MDEERSAHERRNVGALILACFLLSSTGYLSWVYHLMELFPTQMADALSMVGGYALQAVGIGAFMLLAHGAAEARMRQAAVLGALGGTACLALATLSVSPPVALCLGLLGNLSYGILAGFYLGRLAARLAQDQRGLAFGGGYAGATLLTWLLSLAHGGAPVRGVPALVSCCVLTTFVVALVVLGGRRDGCSTTMPAAPPFRDGRARKTLALACGIIVLASMVKNMGYSFPTTDLVSGVSLELSRLFYGLGLVAAGAVSDRSRRHGALCCACALVMPFLLLALRGASAPATALWAVDYLLYGFFSVFRVTLLADLAAAEGTPQLAGAGLLFGRLGDAAGTALCLSLAGNPLALITTTSLLFVATMALFFVLDQRLFAPTVPEEPAAPSGHERFESFAGSYGLSQREREVLHLVLDGRSNAEIASELYVSEATVKFHVRNLLRKTGCQRRIEIVNRYATEA